MTSGHRHPDLDLRPRSGQGRRRCPPPERRAGLHGHRHRADLLPLKPCRTAASRSWSPGDEVYEGQLAGIHSRDNDLVIQPDQGQEARTTCALPARTTIQLTPALKFTLEQALEFIDDDELVEVTLEVDPSRKKMLNKERPRRYEAQQGLILARE